MADKLKSFLFLLMTSILIPFFICMALDACSSKNEYTRESAATEEMINIEVYEQTTLDDNNNTEQ